MRRNFGRVAIVNRGEAAMRFIHAAREFNREQETDLRTIALFTDPDRHALFVREADEAILLGPARILHPETNLPKSSYVDYGRLANALRAAKADAVWVGWGFVAEHASFADLCDELGLVFIGPSGEVMRQLGDKITSKHLAEHACVPVAPWSNGPVETVEEALRQGERLGFPLLVKATAGGGGHGIRRVDSVAQLPKAFESARAEAFNAFGDPTVFMERLIQDARHIEVQIIADHYGTVWAAGVRDCTIQRRHQKILEEAPSPVLTLEQDEALRQAAVSLSRMAGYENAGTVEFLYEPASRTFSFMEMNTRLQVEHPVTECTTGLDLVKLQLHVAQGGRLEGSPPHARGHAIEVRLNAEDPDREFAPAPGVIERFRVLTGAGVRVDSGCTEGDSIPSEFDSMIAKIIGYGATRKEALSRLERAIRESVIVIRGGASNRSFLLDLLQRPEVQNGDFDTGWLDRLTALGEHVSRDHADVAIVQAAIEAYLSDSAREQAQFYRSAGRGRPTVRTEIGRTVELRYRGQTYSPRVRRLGPRQFRVNLDGVTMAAVLDQLGRFEYWLTLGEQRFYIVSIVESGGYQVEVNGISHRIERDDGGVVRSPAPAVVISLIAKPGDTVAAGQPVAILEAMKMEMRVTAPVAGTVRHWMTMPHVQVGAGDPLLQIDPAVGVEYVAAGARVTFSGSETPKDGGALEVLRQLVLGYDADPMQTGTLLATHKEDVNCDEMVRREDEIFEIFVDICSLFRRRPEMTRSGGSEGVTAEACLFAYLRGLEANVASFPQSFVDSLKRVLHHYGIQTLERSKELEDAMFCVYRSHAHVEQQLAAVLTLLSARRERVRSGLETPHDESLRKLLGRMISVTRDILPALADVAEDLRYRLFDQPIFELARKQVYEQVESHLECLAADLDLPDRAERVHALLECPQPLAGLFSRYLMTADPPLRRLMLEVITARHYRIRKLSEFRHTIFDGHSCVSSEYDHEGTRIHVFATYVALQGLSAAVQLLNAATGEVPAEHDVVMDFFTYQTDPGATPEQIQRTVHELVNQAGFLRRIRRIVVIVGSADKRELQYFTFRPNGSGYEEETLYRGLHPMMAKRLHLWRLNNFRLTRLPSVEDIYLLHAVAHENPNDERLFACAEVRDLTPVRNEAGKITGLPHLERMLAEALAAMRVFQSQRPSNRRLFWNRILLYIWPQLTISPDELNDIVHRLAPSTDGLGLEQVVVRVRIPNPETGEPRDTIIRISAPVGAGLLLTFRPAGALQPLKPLTDYAQKVVRMRQRGFTYPYEIVKMLAPPLAGTQSDFPPGDFIEHDLDSDSCLVPVNRPYGQNHANIIAGVIRSYTPKHPEGMARVLLLGDPSKDLGALAKPECERIIAAIELASRMGVPIEWFPISAGAKISMDSGVENMDWIALVLRRLVEFTQAGGEVNLLVNGINVGAQPYWNAEATMLMHTRGILIMTPKGAMVLTGKRALDYSGGVSAEDNLGIGGYDRIMGLNGQAQYWARDLEQACHILMRHYEHTYVAPGERFPRKTETHDPIERDVRVYPHNGDHLEDGFSLVGDIFSDEFNAGRKKSFEIRKVMMSVIDQDHRPLERWAGMRGAETAVVWDAHLGGYPVCLIGIESRPLPRFGFVPADGPDQWCAGTLFPQSSKKVARGINAASNNRPVVLLANLSGFDGSPESMRKLQLEYGAEIGRAVVNFKGPIVFCVISRYHGGAYVVFSRMLNENLEVAALSGTYASVIGGAPAAAVVFAGEVEARARKDPRLQAILEKLNQASGADKVRLRTEWEESFKAVHSEKLGEMADEFDKVHSVQRALEVGALDRIISPESLRPYLIHAVERGISKTFAAMPKGGPEMAELLHLHASLSS